MILKRVGYYFFFAVIILMLSKCKQVPFKSEKITEGYIEYNIEYHGDSMDSFIQSFLPDKMQIKFKDHNLKNRMECMSGLFKLTNIKKYEEQTNISLVNFLNKKYKYIEKSTAPSLFFEQRPDVIIERTDSTKTIAGIICQEAKITYPTNASNQKEKFSIFYTNQIDIKGFNNQTPFESMDGVLLEFQLLFYDVPMKFTATKIKQTSISSDEFEVPENYKRINRKTMKEIIELLK